MSHTVTRTVDENWTKINANELYIQVRAQAPGMVLINVNNDGTPDPSDYSGFILSMGGLRLFDIELEAGDMVFARKIGVGFTTFMVTEGGAAGGR